MLGNTQPNQTPQTEKKSGRGLRFLFNTLTLIIILALAGLGAFRSALAARQANERAILSQQLGEQLQLALVDIEFGRYEIAKQRLEFIIAHDPSFPGVQEKLTEVLVKINLQENYVPPTATPLPTSTPDFSGAEQAFTRAQQLIAAQDWSGAISALDTLRKLDPNYQASQVDGMYYFALRNNGYDLITKHGNLEGGIYQFTLAERFGILDNTANGLREGARYYLLGASFWDLDWQQAVYYFTQVAGGWPSLWDGTLTASDRFRIASMRYGDDLLRRKQYCEAYVQYDNAQKVGQLDQTAADGFREASLRCYPPTVTPTATLEVIPTTETLPVADTPIPVDTPATPGP